MGGGGEWTVHKVLSHLSKLLGLEAQAQTCSGTIKCGKWIVRLAECQVLMPSAIHRPLEKVDFTGYSTREFPYIDARVSAAL